MWLKTCTDTNEFITAFNSLAPGRHGNNVNNMNFKIILWNNAAVPSGSKPLPGSMLLIQIYVALWRQYATMWPSDAIRRSQTRSSLALLIACRQINYLNQCWLIISGIHLKTLTQQDMMTAISEVESCTSLLSAICSVKQALWIILLKCPMLTCTAPPSPLPPYNILDNLPIDFMGWLTFPFAVISHLKVKISLCPV